MEWVPAGYPCLPPGAVHIYWYCPTCGDYMHPEEKMFYWQFENTPIPPWTHAEVHAWSDQFDRVNGVPRYRFLMCNFEQDLFGREADGCTHFRNVYFYMIEENGKTDFVLPDSWVHCYNQIPLAMNEGQE